MYVMTEMTIQVSEEGGVCPVSEIDYQIDLHGPLEKRVSAKAQW